MVNKVLATTRPGVFAIGDNTSGPATVIEAVAQGNKVAVAVDRYLQTGELVNPVYEPAYEFPEQLFNLDDYADAKRPAMPELEVATRIRNWEEVDLGLDEDDGARGVQALPAVRPGVAAQDGRRGTADRRHVPGRSAEDAGASS